MFTDDLDDFIIPGIKIEETAEMVKDKKSKLRQKANALIKMVKGQSPSYERRMNQCDRIVRRASKKKRRIEEWDVQCTTVCSIDHEQAQAILKVKPGRPIRFRALSYENVPDLWKLILLRKEHGHKCGALADGTLQKTVGALSRFAWFLVAAEWVEPEMMAKKGGFVWGFTRETLEHKNSLMVVAGSADGSSSGSAPILDGISMRKQFFSQIMACFSVAAHRNTALCDLLLDQLTDEEILNTVPPDIENIQGGLAARKLLKARLQSAGNCARGLHQIAHDEEMRKLCSDKEGWTEVRGNRHTMGSDKIARFRRFIVNEVSGMQFCLLWVGQ